MNAPALISKQGTENPVPKKNTSHVKTGGGLTQHMDTQGQATHKAKKKTLKLQNIDYIGYIGIASTELNYESTSIHKLAPVSSLQIKNTP